MSKINWEDLYTDLNSRTANALRDARVKPDQLQTMSDGEITAIDGIGEVSLEEIRAKYSADTIIETLDAKDAKHSASSKPENQVQEEAKRKPRHINRGGKKIKAMASKVDRTKLYDLKDAVKLVKATNITSFDSTLTLHLNLSEKMTRVEVTFPHVAGAAKKVAIADDALIAKIEKGQIEFDILLTTPAMMPKLAQYARILGPKGLMPSPKTGTVTTDPEAKAKEFAGGKTMVKGESKFPLMHVVVGKTSQDENELIENIQAALQAVKLTNITKAVIASTMSPGIKLQLN